MILINDISVMIVVFSNSNLYNHILKTESERVYVYVPLDKLNTEDIDEDIDIEDVELLAGYGFKDLHVTNRLTDDKKIKISIDSYVA